MMHVELFLRSLDQTSWIRHTAEQSLNVMKMIKTLSRASGRSLFVQDALRTLESCLQNMKRLLTSICINSNSRLEACSS